MTYLVSHRAAQLTTSLGNAISSNSLLNHSRTRLDTAHYIPESSPTDKVLAKYFSAGLLNADYQLQTNAAQWQLPFLDQEKLQAIDRLLSHNLGFHIPLLNQEGIYTISLSMKEFLRELQKGCREKNIKIENILIIGGAVPWILGSKYCVDLLESIVPGSTASLSDKEFMSIDLPPNDVDIRFIISPESKAQIPWLKNRIVAYLAGKLPSHYSQSEREDMITSIGNVFQEFQETILWDQKNQQIDIDYFIFGINDLSQSKYEVSLVSLLRRPFLFSMQNLCLDIQDFLAEEKAAIALRPKSISQPQDSREAVQAILEKVARFFHVPYPETVDKKGWIYYCSLLTKLYYCPEKSSLSILCSTTIQHCIKESKDPSKKGNSPVSFLVALLKAAIQKHHDVQPEDVLAFTFNMCSTAEERLSQSDLSLLWQASAANLNSSFKSLLPLHVFSRAMHDAEFSFEVLSAFLEVQAFFYLCSPHAARSNDFTAYLIANDGKMAVQLVDKNRGLLLPFNPLKAFRIIDEKLTELSNQGKLSSLTELEHLWSAFWIPTNPNEERIPPFVREKAFLEVDYSSLEMLAIHLMEHEDSLGRRLGYKLFLLVQKLHPETRRRNWMVRHLPDMIALEKSRGDRIELLQEISKVFLAPPLTEASLLMQEALDTLTKVICQPKLSEKEILIEWSLSLARIRDHSFYSDVLHFWKQYQSRIHGENDELSKPLIKALLPSNILMAGQLLLRIPSYSIEEKLPLFFTIFSAHIQQKKVSQYILNLEMCFQLTMQLLPSIPEEIVDKGHLITIVHHLLEELLLRKQPAQIHALLLAEEKKRVLAARDAAKFWASLCCLNLNDPAKGIIPALEVFQEASNYGIWNECKPRKLILQIIAGLYALGDLFRWHQADGFVVDLYNDPETSEEIRTTAIGLLIKKKERISLKESPFYKKIKDWFHPAERLEGLQDSLHEYIAGKNVQNALLVLKELAEIDPLPKSFKNELVSVCNLVDPTGGNALVDLTIAHDLLKILCHPFTLKVFPKPEFFPLNFAISLCHQVELQGVELLDSMIANLLPFYRNMPKGMLINQNRRHFISLISKIVQSTNPKLLKQLSDHSNYIAELLQEGDYFNSLCVFVMNCREKQIPLDEKGSLNDRLITGLQKILDHGDVPAIFKAQALLKTLPCENARLSDPRAAMKQKMMDALLRHHFFAEAGEWFQYMMKETILASLSPLVAMNWISLLVAGKQFEAAAELLKLVSKSSIESREACTRLWLSFPDEMYELYPQIGANLCLQAPKEMIEEFRPIAAKVLSSSLKTNGHSISLDNALSLMERYEVSHPHTWQRIFANIEAQTGQETKAKQKLLPLLSRIAEPAGFFLGEPASRRACWLSALRCFIPSLNDQLGDSWKRILENGSEFLEIFPASDPAIVGEAFTLLLEVWIASLQKPNEDPDVFTRIMPTVDMLKPILSHPEARLKVLLQLVRGGSYTMRSGVLVATCEVFESSLNEIDSVWFTINYETEAEAAKVLKRLLSVMQKIIQKNPNEQGSLRKLFVKIIQKTGNVLNEESFLGVLQHLLTLDVFLIDGEYAFLAEIMNFLVQKFDATNSSESEPIAVVQVSHLLTSFLKKFDTILTISEESEIEFPIDLFLQYSCIWKHQAFSHFAKPADEQQAFDHILQITQLISLDTDCLNKHRQEVLTEFIINGFPYHKVEYANKAIFFDHGVHILIQILVVTKDINMFFNKFEKFVENYGVYLSSSELFPNQIRIHEFQVYYSLLMSILEHSSGLQELIDKTPKPEGIGDLEVNRCYEAVINYFCNKFLEILYSSTSSSFQQYKPEMIHLIDQIIKHPLFLRERNVSIKVSGPGDTVIQLVSEGEWAEFESSNNQGSYTSYFDVLTTIFLRLERMALYSDDHLHHRIHCLIFKYMYRTVHSNPSSWAMGVMTEVLNWAIDSKQPLCMYRWLRILELNQDSFYTNNLKELVSVYVKTIDEVVKNPFYKIAWFYRIEPDRLAKRELGKHLRIEPPVRSLRNDFDLMDLPPSLTDNKVYLCEALLESFSGLEFMYTSGKAGSDYYRVLWTKVFTRFVDILNRTWDDSFDEAGYARVIALLQKLIDQAKIAKYSYAIRTRDHDILNTIFENVPRLNERSTQKDFMEAVANIASIIEVLDHPQFMLKGHDGSKTLSAKAQEFIKGLERSSLFDLVHISVIGDTNLIVDFISKAIIPTSLEHLLKFLQKNAETSVEDRIMIFKKIDQDIMANLSNNEKIWAQRLYKLLRIQGVDRVF